MDGENPAAASSERGSQGYSIGGTAGGGGGHGRLLVCATPIGNLEDVTLRVLAALREVDIVACEDTRHTKVLLDRHGIAAKLVSYHEHNERARAAELVERMRVGAVVALVSDAGMPLVSDPGFALVRACIEVDLAVEVLPGPSSVSTALVASGLPAERWRFVGFLPRKAAERGRLLERAEETLVAFESPRRLTATLAQLAERDPDRPLAVCRELTKLHEEVRRGTAAELAAYYHAQAPRGEVVLVLGPARPARPVGLDPARPARAGDGAGAVDALRELVDAGARARPAAKVVAKLTGASANELYRQLTDAPRREGGEAL
ncbi:MAG TPA: 16S rRNA (cytidine(1402)-2'-O)-methyltransferase [Solirubrobacteraceae bacterium]